MGKLATSIELTKAAIDASGGADEVTIELPWEPRLKFMVAADIDKMDAFNTCANTSDDIVVMTCANDGESAVNILEHYEPKIDAAKILIVLYTMLTEDVEEPDEEV